MPNDARTINLFRIHFHIFVKSPRPARRPASRRRKRGRQTM